MKISQSLIKDTIPVDACALMVKYKYIDQIEADNEDDQGAMFKGSYFEWHLLGTNREGIEPIFKPLKIGRKNPDGSKDYRPIDQVRLDARIAEAKKTLLAMGLDPTKGLKQVQIETEKDSGNLDWITTDFQNPEQECIIDVKYTETKYEDRWIGWADFENNEDAKLQSVHYIKLYKDKYNKYVPFYYFVFGKSGWTRIIKVEITELGLAQYQATYNRATAKVEQWKALNWPASPEDYKCSKCIYANFCKERTFVPDVEVFLI